MDLPLLARACIRIWFPEKSIHPFTRRVFSVDFHSFCVWRLAFPSVHTGRKMTVKGWFRKPSQSKTVENQEGSSIIALIAVNTWKSKPSHLKRLKIKKKEPLCERVNAFLKVKKTYRGTVLLGQKIVRFLLQGVVKHQICSIQETYLKVLLSGKSSRPSGCALKGQKPAALGRAERSEVAPWAVSFMPLRGAAWRPWTFTGHQYKIT